MVDGGVDVVEVVVTPVAVVELDSVVGGVAAVEVQATADNAAASNGIRACRLCFGVLDLRREKIREVNGRFSALTDRKRETLT